MPRSTATTMIHQVVQRLSRWVPRSEPVIDREEWADSDRSWHGSSFDLRHGLVVTELFGERRAPPGFADTLPAYHEPPLAEHAPPSA